MPAVANKARWTLHEKQKQAFFNDSKVTVVVAGRRGGKSEVAMMKTLAVARDYALRGVTGVIWVVGPTYKQLRVLWRKALKLAPDGWITRTVGSDVRPDMMEMGTVRIEFRSADNPATLVSEGVLFLLVDESGIIKEQAWNESLQPTLIDHNAPAWLIGTPKGRNWFHQQYTRGVDPDIGRVQSFSWTSYENPFVSPEGVKALADEMPKRMYRQEILARFLTDEGAVFRGHRGLVAPFSTGSTVVLGVDLGKQHDFTVIVGLDARGRCTHFDRFRKVSWPQQRRRIARVARTTGARLILDATGVGDPVFDELREKDVNTYPYKFTNESKRKLVEGLANEIEEAAAGERILTLPDEPVLLNELDIFEYETLPSGRIRYNAPEGYHDDTVMALALAKWGLNRFGSNPDGTRTVNF